MRWIPVRDSFIRVKASSSVDRGQPKLRRTKPVPPVPNDRPSLNATRAWFRKKLNGRSEEHTSELQSHSDLHSFPTRRSSDLVILCTQCRLSGCSKCAGFQSETASSASKLLPVSIEGSRN